MAFAKVDSLTRSEVGTATDTPYTRGFVLNGEQVEIVLVTKLTGDTSGNLDLSNIKRPSALYVIPTRDNAGANVASLAVSDVAFTRTDDDTLALTSLANWTVAIIIATGRSYA